jgi:hypothetical protein
MPIAVRINSQNQQKVRSQTPIATTSLVSLTDVSAVEIVDNSTIVYNASTLRYEIKPLPVIFGGTF